MLLREIVSDVVETLRRPDMTNFVTQRVRQQIKFLHSMDNWPRDVIDHLLEIQNPDYRVRLALPPRFRAMSSIIPMDEDSHVGVLTTDSMEQVGFKEVDPRKTRGYHGSDDRDYYFLAGDVMNIQMHQPFPKLLVSYFAYPDLTSDSAVTWVTEFWPELVIYRVLYVCHVMLGNADQARGIESLYMEALEAFKENAAYGSAV